MMRIDRQISANHVAVCCAGVGGIRTTPSWPCRGVLLLRQLVLVQSHMTQHGVGV